MNSKTLPTIPVVLADPCTSYWLKDAIRTACNRDLLDALRDAELLAKLLGERLQEVERTYMQVSEEPVPYYEPDDYPDPDDGFYPDDL